MEQHLEKLEKLKNLRISRWMVQHLVQLEKLDTFDRFLKGGIEMGKVGILKDRVGLTNCAKRILRRTIASGHVGHSMRSFFLTFLHLSRFPAIPPRDTLHGARSQTLHLSIDPKSGCLVEFAPVGPDSSHECFRHPTLFLSSSLSSLSYSLLLSLTLSYSHTLILSYSHSLSLSLSLSPSLPLSLSPSHSLSFSLSLSLETYRVPERRHAL